MAKPVPNMSSSWIRKERRLAVYLRDAFACCYCGTDLRNAKPAEMGLDHLEDLVPGGGHKGGNHANTNIVTVCRRCNSSRQDAPYTVFAAKFPGALARIETQRHAFVNIEMAKSLIAGSAESDR